MDFLKLIKGFYCFLIFFKHFAANSSHPSRLTAAPALPPFSRVWTVNQTNQCTARLTRWHPIPSHIKFVQKRGSLPKPPQVRSDMERPWDRPPPSSEKRLTFFFQDVSVWERPISKIFRRRRRGAIKGVRPSRFSRKISLFRFFPWLFHASRILMLLGTRRKSRKKRFRLKYATSAFFFFVRVIYHPPYLHPFDTT